MSKNVLRVAILAAAFNERIVGPMIEAAADEVARRGGTVHATVRVPGAYDLPLPAKRLLARPETDLLIVLGYIERGETLHGEVMGHAVHQALLQLELTHEKPIGLGMIGPGATAEQAELRKEAYARAAVAAAFAAHSTLEAMEQPPRTVGFGGGSRAGHGSGTPAGRA